MISNNELHMQKYRLNATTEVPVLNYACAKASTVMKHIFSKKVDAIGHSSLAEPYAPYHQQPHTRGYFSYSTDIALSKNV